MGTVELLVGIVLGIDALIVLGVVASRLNGRRSRRGEVASVDPERLAAVASRPVATAGTPIPESVEHVSDQTVQEAAPPISGLAPSEPEVDVGAEALETLGAEPQPATPLLAQTPEPAEAQPAVAPAGPRAAPIGLDYAPTWVDPMTMASAAASEWRRGLRRDLARAARKGRPGLVMLLKLDIEGRTDLSIQELARIEGLLEDTIATRVRDGDYLDRTGPGRFHMIMAEMPESGAVAVADRIIHAFREDAPDSPHLLVGWAAMETEGDVALALQRAAERVRDDSLPFEGDLRPDD